MLNRSVTSREVDVIRNGLHQCSFCGSCDDCFYRKFDDCYDRLFYDAYVLIGELVEQDCG